MPNLDLDQQSFFRDRIQTSADLEQREYDSLIDVFSYHGLDIGYISVSISQAETRRKIRETIILLSLLTVTILLPIIVVVWISVTKFLHPLLMLTKLSAEMAQGNLAQQIDTHDRDEIGILAGSLAHMRDEIRTSPSYHSF